MLKKIFIVTFLLINSLQAITLQTTKELYSINEEIIANFTELEGNNENWIAIYPANSNNDWGNVLQWDWTNVANGSHTFKPLPAGEYQVRLFYNNSFILEAKKTFTVEDNGNIIPLNLQMNKTIYKPSETPKVIFENMSGDTEDWIGIYPKNSNNDWGNVIQWSWAGSINGEHTFKELPVGEYEARGFFNNSFNLEASTAFTVKEQPPVILDTTLDVYGLNEKPIVTFNNLSGDDEDWIAIYPKGSSNDWGNVIQWDWARAINGNHVFQPLPIGEYEVRVFFNNSFNMEASKSFSIKNLPIESKIYEDAENGLNPNWVKISGNYAPIHYTGGGFESKGALVLVPQWKEDANGWTNIAAYSLKLNADASKKVLELDVGGLANYKLPNGVANGYMPHYNISVWFTTLNGPRRIIWDSFYNHNGITKPFLSNEGQTINSPSPVEHVRGWYKPVDLWEHFSVNIETLLQEMEPNNAVTSIDTLTFTGGFLDNIKLSNR